MLKATPGADAYLVSLPQPGKPSPARLAVAAATLGPNDPPRILRLGVTLLELTRASERQLDLLLDDDKQRRRWESTTAAIDAAPSTMPLTTTGPPTVLPTSIPATTEAPATPAPTSESTAINPP